MIINEDKKICLPQDAEKKRAVQAILPMPAFRKKLTEIKSLFVVMRYAS
jgi:hypothetical protein